MLPSWYPTKHSPISGSFFKEQAVCLSRDYDFAVVLVEQSWRRWSVKSWLSGLTRRAVVVEKVEDQPGYREFVVSLNFFEYPSLLARLLRRARVIPRKTKSEERREKVGSLLSILRTKHGLRPALVYAMTAQVIGGLAKDFCEHLGVPLVLSEHVPFPLPGTVLSEDVRRAIEECDSLLVVSQDKSRQILMQDLSCQPVVVGNLVDESQFQLRTQVSRGAKNLLAVASYNFYKDYPTLLRAFSILETRTTVPFRITLVGFSPYSQPDGYNYGEKKFLQLLESFGLKMPITLVPFAERWAMPAYYENADAFVLSSIQEGLPVSSLEAACCGVPVFSTRCGGVEDFVDDTVGRLVPVRDSDALATCLCDYLEGRITFDPALIRSQIVSRYGRQAFRTKFQQIFEPLISR